MLLNTLLLVKNIVFLLSVYIKGYCFRPFEQSMDQKDMPFCQVILDKTGDRNRRKSHYLVNFVSNLFLHLFQRQLLQALFYKGYQRFVAPSGLIPINLNIEQLLSLI